MEHLTLKNLPADICLDDFTYDLPSEKIALFPLAQRDHSRLQVYRQGQITHTHFYELAQFIPAESLLVFNNTRVIPARIYFRRSSGAVIEIFLLQPENLHESIHTVMQMQGGCTWKCLIGNKKRWKEGEVLQQSIHLTGTEIQLTASLLNRDEQLVHLQWTPATVRFSELLPQLGEIPLPPYLNRRVTDRDQESYQTVYSVKEGAVAAPTAGLHFTEAVLASLREKGVNTDFVTLHVGAGTFQPIKATNVLQHPMHGEQIVFNQANIRLLLEKIAHIVAVGTTSMRALESLYWYGVKLLLQPADTSFFIKKLFPYESDPVHLPTASDALQQVLLHMEQNGYEEVIGETQILIVPGYSFRLCKGLVTNYHQPGSTLLLLIAAFIGPDWRKVYAEALENNYRFLSYGDSSLLLP
jgi:S-adenosylmethionine:tRNA ribosyltransferase-isomerase